VCFRHSEPNPWIVEIAKSKAALERWNNPNANGHIRAAADNSLFTIKYVALHLLSYCRVQECTHSGRCLGVFDTVGSIGLPEELRFSHKIRCLFGFPNNHLGPHVENAFHAMALDERRSDFVSSRSSSTASDRQVSDLYPQNVAKFVQTDEGRRKGQVLKQVWFTGVPLLED
jgi:T6SS, Phospholipase effector Tle1-like, catalytic domain